jgi:hypothetical protein
LPDRIDRVYSSLRAISELGWNPQFGYAEVLAELDRRSSEVLPSKMMPPRHVMKLMR